jgi:excisionase family DNA binding protein
MTVAEVAKAFKVSEKSVSRWRKAGKVTFLATPGGRHIRYYRGEIEALLRGQPLTPEQVAALKRKIGGQL